MLLLMAQVDDVPGELLGDFIKQCETVGARNIQIVPAITKKTGLAILSMSIYQKALKMILPYCLVVN